MKAILVIDMPKSCAECTLRTSLEANYLYCIATLPRLKIDPMTASNIKEHRCPLRPLPEKKNATKIWVKNSEDVAEAMKIGWNACIEELDKC